MGMRTECSVSSDLLPKLRELDQKVATKGTIAGLKAAAQVVFVYRAATAWLSVGLGGIALVALRRERRRGHAHHHALVPGLEPIDCANWTLQGERLWYVQRDSDRDAQLAVLDLASGETHRVAPLQDAHGVAETLKSAQQGNYSLDKSRSAFYAERIRNFPLNSEFEVVLMRRDGRRFPASLVSSRAADVDGPALVRAVVVEHPGIGA